MACPTTPRMLVERPLGIPIDSRFGLFSAAAVIENIEPHAEEGLTYTTVCDPAVKPYPRLRCDPGGPGTEPPNPTKAADRSMQVVTADPFAVYAAEACFGLTAPPTSRERLRQRLTAGEAHTVEAAIYHGWSGARPFIRDPDGEVLSATAVDLITALGILEHRLAVLGRTGVIHAPRWMAPWFDRYNLVTRNNGQVVTLLGNRVAFGSGYDGQPPLGTDDTNTWLYATGPVTVSRSGLVEPGNLSDGAFDPRTNTLFLLTERVYVVDWPCQVIGIPVDMERPEGLVVPPPGLAPTVIAVPSSGASPLEVEVFVDNHGQGATTVDLGDGSAPVPVPDGGSITHTYTTAGTYTVRATSDTNPALTSTTTVTVTAPVVPPVTGLTATPVDAASVDLAWSWTADSGEPSTGFLIEYRNGTGGTWTTFTTTDPAARTATVTGLTGNTAYTFRVTPLVAGGQGNPATATATTPPAVIPAPVATAALAGDTAADVEWEFTTPPGGTVTGFLVEYQASGDPGWTTSATTGEADRAHQVTGLAPDTEYLFRVTPLTPSGPGPASNTPSVTTPPAAPPAVTDLTGTPVSPTTVDLAWAWAPAPGGEDATGFLIESWEDGDTEWTPQGTAAGTDRDFTITDLNPGSSYTLRVTPQTATQEGPGASVIVTMPPPPEPPAVTGLSATPVDVATVDLAWSWSPAPDGGEDATGFLVEYQADGETEWTTSGTAAGAARAHQVTGLTAGTAYTLRVTPITASANGPAATVTATTPNE